MPAIDEHQVLIQVEACGVCHGDAMVADGAAGDYPHIPGHEVVGHGRCRGRFPSGRPRGRGLAQRLGQHHRPHHERRLRPVHGRQRRRPRVHSRRDCRGRGSAGSRKMAAPGPPDVRREKVSSKSS